ncbi:MAG: hypothetical protein JEY94_07450 [Melioribacteraceae bacterium]|nr:hypothetical protein [Melioribacteraceae bacterium]
MDEKKFIKIWIEKLKNGMVKSFPNDFIGDAETELMALPGKALVLGPELFGTFEVLDSDKHLFYQAQDLMVAKYLLYANRNKPAEINFITDLVLREAAIKNYEKHLDEIVMEIVKDFRLQIPNSKKFFEASNQIFNMLNLQRY